MGILIWYEKDRPVIMNSDILKCLRPTYAVIDLDRLSDNIESARGLSNSDIIAVVKADAYGHGAREVSRHAYSYSSVKNFAVATVIEGISLRKDSDVGSARIFVLGYVDEMLYGELIGNNLTIAIYDWDIAAKYHKYLADKYITAPVVIKIDTGMGRLGFNVDLDFADFSKKFPRFNIVHIMSHLATSGTDQEFVDHQESLFKSFLNRCKGSFDTSLFNSCAITTNGNSYDYTRPGILMYGYADGPEKDKFKPVMSIYSKIVQVRRLETGQSVSYDRQFIAKKPTVIGVVPIGYADGYPRSLTNKGIMVVNGVRCPVVGRVCMDMTMIDVTALGENLSNAQVEVMGDNIDATEIGKLAGTIGYEILCGISSRIPRYYNKNRED